MHRQRSRMENALATEAERGSAAWVVSGDYRSPYSVTHLVGKSCILQGEEAPGEYATVVCEEVPREGSGAD